MNNLNDLFKTRLDNIKTAREKTTGRPINLTWEKAKEFGDYVGLNTPVVLRLFKIYGEPQVLSIKSWLFDVPFDPSRGGKIALAHWRLKQLIDEKNKGTTIAPVQK